MGTDTLWRLPFCREMTSAEVREIRALARDRSLARGEVLFKEGAPGDAAFVVLYGSLEVRKQVPGVGSTVIATVGPNGMVGEMALLTEMPRSGTVVAAEDTELLEIPKAAFEQLVKKQSVAALKVCQNIAVMLAERLRKINQEVVRLTAELAGSQKPGEVDTARKILSQWAF